MSILHVNQIAGALHRMFDGHIDLTDASPYPEDREKCFLSVGSGVRAVADDGGPRRKPCRSGAGDSAAADVDRTGPSAVLPDLQPCGDGCISATKQCKKEQGCACSAASGS